jgi:hypothetical protein
LALVKEFNAVTATNNKLVCEALLAGFGAIAFFRTSLFTIRVSGTDIGVGPSTLLKALLDSSDMMLNRWQALNRGAQVRAIMEKVDFDKAKTALPTTCFTLMNEFPAAVQTSVGEQVKKLADRHDNLEGGQVDYSGHLHDSASRRRCAGPSGEGAGYDD